VISDSENGSAADEESSSSEPEAGDSGSDSGRDSPGSHRDNDDEADDDNGNGGDHGGSGYRADPTPEQSTAAREILQEVYWNAQDAAITELQQSDPVCPLHSYLTLPLNVDCRLTPGFRPVRGSWQGCRDLSGAVI
jgi:hypothetical protein